MSSLPPEVLDRISELLDATHPKSLVTFAQTGKQCYAVASRMLFRTIKITLTDGERLSNEVHTWQRALVRDGALQHVRRLILGFDGYNDGIEPDHNPYLSLAQCERSDNHEDLESCWDLYFYQWGGGAESGIKEAEWKLLARLVKRLSGLTDFIFACPGPFPPLLLQTLHNGPSRCRLNHYTFRLSARDEALVQADERALITSPCLFTIGDLGAQPSEARNTVTFRLLARRNAPSLRRVFSYWQTPEIYGLGSHEHETKSNWPNPPAL